MGSAPTAVNPLHARVWRLNPGPPAASTARNSTNGDTETPCPSSPPAPTTGNFPVFLGKTGWHAALPPNRPRFFAVHARPGALPCPGGVPRHAGLARPRPSAAPYWLWAWFRRTGTGGAAAHARAV